MKDSFRFMVAMLAVGMGAGFYTPVGHARETAGLYLICLGFIVSLFAVVDAIRDKK